MRETHLRQGRQTVKLGLIKVIHDLFPEERLKTSYSILEGVFCNLVGSALSTREVRQIDARLKEWAADPASIITLLGREGGYHVYQVGDHVARVVYPALQQPSQVEPFEVIPFAHGFIVDFGDIDKGDGAPLIPPTLLSAAYAESQEWLDRVDVEVVADVNALISSGRTRKLVSIAEALHEKRLSDIADVILSQRRALRVLAISGPSSSGKTTTTQRLATQLEVNGLKPVALSLDNYFVNRELTPVDEDGQYDFESPDALDLPLLTHHLAELVDGRPIGAPTFDFVTGSRLPGTTPIQVGPSEILLIEGLHALNPRLVEGVKRNAVFKVYVSALGGLNIDLMNRVPTTEVRLLRRIVRDHRTRGISPELTMDRWDSVRRGEYAHVFLFQEDADVMFNSSMMYELNALHPHAEAALATIPDASPHVDARDRLLNLLTFFEPIGTDRVPSNSILREFIGGSIYDAAT
ncbi:nucleoside kinase [Tessaracoccus sp. MC1627]|uniref:nucleoside kinase n=1 Tax=Tessaracoccus sp. MC1627 TaxID=2760312 RepID=UPI0016005787|nr:nucleoside kinase [Tessaracoccus sp. MC1627]MBB1511304.1 nucleoside kinase [Tessaracoccus sp. MC1627]